MQQVVHGGAKLSLSEVYGDPGLPSRQEPLTAKPKECGAVRLVPGWQHGVSRHAHRRHFWGSTPELKGLLHMAVGAVDALLCRVAVVNLKQFYLG